MSVQSQVRRGSRLSRRVGQTLTRLARVTSELSSATTIDQVTAIVTEHMADAMGATIAALALREGDHLRLIGVRGLDADEARAWQSIPLATSTTVTDVVSTGERIVLVGAEEIAARYPHLGNARRGERSTVTVPRTFAGNGSLLQPVRNEATARSKTPPARRTRLFIKITFSGMAKEN